MKGGRRERAAAALLRAGGVVVERLAGAARVAPPGAVLLFFDAARKRLRYVDEAGQLSTLKQGGGGGVSAHPDLTGLAWTSSGHTGTGLAGFSGAGTAGNVSIGTGLDLSGGTLEVDTTTISTTGYAEGLAADAEAASQPRDGDLTALAALSSTGMVVRIGTDSYALRTITGSGGISVAYGDGVSDGPVISFSGGTGLDDNPNRALTISFVPANATIYSRDSSLTARSTTTGNTDDNRTTILSGSIADIYTTTMNCGRTSWVGSSRYIYYEITIVTSASVAATCRIKSGFTAGGLTTTDTETASRPTAIFRYLTGLSHTKFMCYSQNASGSEETDSGVTVSTNTKYVLEIRMNTAETKFYINGSLVATHSSYKFPTSTDFGFQSGVYATGRSIHVVGGRYYVAWQ